MSSTHTQTGALTNSCIEGTSIETHIQMRHKIFPARLVGTFERLPIRQIILFRGHIFDLGLDLLVLCIDLELAEQKCVAYRPT